MENTHKSHAKQYVVITGASSGIGASFAKRFAKDGYSLVLVARHLDKLRDYAKALDRITKPEQEILCIPADLGKMREVRKVFMMLRKKDIVFFINNAGFGDCGYFLDGDVKKELSMIDVNVKAVHLSTKLALRLMHKKQYGYVLNVASSAGLIPAGPYMATYYATKAYVVSLTRAIAMELRLKKSPVYIGALCPGPVDTHFNDVANVEFALKGISADYCVNYAVDQMLKRRVVIVPTLRMKLATTFGRFLPTNVYVWLVAHQQRKKRAEL